MTASALTALVRACGLALLAMAQIVLAAGARQAFDYDIELQAPAPQRKLLEDHLDLYRWRGSERMDEAQLERLVRLAPKQINEFLATEGFYSSRIQAEVVREDRGWVVKLLVEPGEPVRVARFDLEVIGPADDGSPDSRTRREKMLSDWSLRPGAVFRHDDWESAKRNALRVLLLERYPKASIAESRATVNPESNSVELRVILDSGPAFTFGSLEIQGLRRYPASIVERINPIRPGEP